MRNLTVSASLSSLKWAVVQPVLIIYVHLLAVGMAKVQVTSAAAIHCV